MKKYPLNPSSSPNTTLTNIRNCLNEHSLIPLGESLDTIQIRYPEKNWNTWTWSHLLLKDFEFFSKTTYIDIIFFKMLALIGKSNLDRNSAHFDFSRKIFLYTILIKQPNKEVIVIPECGPCGFEIFIAFLAGFKKVVTYDIEERFTKCANSIYQNIEVYISTSAEFSFEQFTHLNPIIIIPDWDHDNLSSKIPKSFLTIKYADRNSFKSHLKKIPLRSLLNLRKKF